ncbi:MAG TPA: hypothetical protein VF220_01550 [Nitrososphaeraceae archaeon]
MKFDIIPYLRNPEKFNFEIDQISRSLLNSIGQTLKNNLKESDDGTKIPIVEIYAETESQLISRMIKNTYEAINLAIENK